MESSRRSLLPHVSPLRVLAVALGGQRGRELVEIALEDRVETMLRELDAVVGEPVLGEVVRADLLRPLAAADLRAPRAALLGRCRRRSCSYNRARRTRIALSRFFSCERSSCMATTMPRERA